MKLTRGAATILLTLQPLSAPGPLAAAVPMTAARAARIDAAVHEGMARTGTRGLALAVVEKGRVVLARAYGERNIEKEPLLPGSVMYAASLTKAVFAYTVLRLADEGKADLDRPVAAMLPKPLPDYGNLDAYGNWGDLKADPRWRRITPRMILTHSTGFANYSFLEPDQKLKFHFDPGTRWGYSGEGIILLQFAIEQGLGIDVARAADRLTFRPLGMTESSFVWRQDFEGRAADGWDAAGKAYRHEKQDRTRASGSMDTDIGDIARFAAALVKGTGLSAGSRADMIRPQLPINTASQFPTIQPDLPLARRVKGLSAGLGVVTFQGPQGEGFYKGGHNEMTGNTMVCIERGKRCVVILGNDVRVEALFPELVRTALGETGAPWRWEYPEQFTRP